MPEEQNVVQAILNRSRVNRFVLVLNLPKKLYNNELFKLKNLQFTITGTIFPDIELHSHNIRYAGQSMNIPGYSRPEYQPLQLIFKIDNEWNNYMTIYNWINILNNDASSILDENNHLDLNGLQEVASAYKDYTTDLSIIQMDEYNNPIIEFVYTSAYPVKLSGYNPDYQKGEEIISTAVFKYNQFIPKTKQYT